MAQQFIKILNTPTDYLYMNFKKHPQKVVFLFWWNIVCINRTENKQEFSDLMKLVKEFKDKWLISSEGEN